MKLKEYLALRGIRQNEFAKRLGVSNSMVSQMCRGEKKPGIDLAMSIYELTNRRVKLADWMQK